MVLTGNGSAFSAGGDLDWIAGRVEDGQAKSGASRTHVRDTMRSFYGLFLAVRALPCPTIAAMNGHAIGAGCCVALACDMRIVAREAKLGLNFTRLGLHPGVDRGRPPREKENMTARMNCVHVFIIIAIVTWHGLLCSSYHTPAGSVRFGLAVRWPRVGGEEIPWAPCGGWRGRQVPR